MSEKKERRVRMVEGIKPLTILDPDNPENPLGLGRFIPNGEYRVTPKNKAQIEQLLDKGWAIEVDPEKPYEKGGLAIGASKGTARGKLTIS